MNENDSILTRLNVDGSTYILRDADPLRVLNGGTNQVVTFSPNGTAIAYSFKSLADEAGVTTDALEQGEDKLIWVAGDASTT